MALWVTDGTEAGCKQLKLFSPNTESQDSGDFWLYEPVGSTLYFRGYQETTGGELWKTNGTPQGTVLVKDMVPGSDGGFPRDFVAAGTQGFFLGVNPATQREEIWTTNGTAAGTRPISDHVDVPDQYWHTLGTVGNKLIAITEPADIWSYSHQDKKLTFLHDLGEAGVVQTATANGGIFMDVVQRNSRALLFTDGTVAGTRQVKEISFINWGTNEMELVAIGSRVFFSAYPDGAFEHVTTLWKSDGSTVGTTVVKEMQDEEGSSYPQHLKTVGGQIYFTADDGVLGAELWKTDGTHGGTQLVADIRTGPKSSTPAGMVEVDGIIYFTADDGVHGRELWKTDGTAEGTMLVNDGVLGSVSSEPEELVGYGGHVYFKARRSTGYGREVWRSDGTARGTQMFSNLYPNDAVWGASPKGLAATDGWLYFTARSQSLKGARAVFRTHGSPGDVSQVAQILGGMNLVIRPPQPGAAFEPTKSVVYFITPTALYRYTEAEAPTVLCSLGGSGDYALSLAGEHVVVHQTPYGGPIWTSDGTVNGTVRAAIASSARYVGLAGNKVYYSSWNGERSELRCIHRTNTGDTSVLPVYENIVTFESLHVEGDVMYFSRTVADQGSYIMRTQGTPETTWAIPGLGERLPDKPYSDYDFPTVNNMQRLGDRLYFAGTGSTGTELFSLSLSGELEIKEMQNDGRLKVLSDGHTIDLKTEAPGQSHSTQLVLTNIGSSPITGLLLSTPELGDFTLSTAAVGTLAPGASTHVDVTFSPQQTGPRQTTVQITGTSLTAVSQNLVLKGSGLKSGSPPFILAQPVSRLVMTGESISLSATVATASPSSTSYRWFRNGVPAGSLPTLDLSPASLKHGGTYGMAAINNNGHAVTAAVLVGVVAPAPTAVEAGDTLKLTCNAKGPTGKMSYQWLRNGRPLASVDRIRGSRSAVLTIARPQPADAADYECIVTLVTPEGRVSLSHGVTTVSLAERPFILLYDERLTTYVGEEVNYSVSATASVGRITAQGLPPGLRITADGTISGRPTRPLAVEPATGEHQPYAVIFKAWDLLTGLDSDPVTLLWTILPKIQAGDFDGVIDRNGELDGGRELGSRVMFTVTSSGTLSGYLQHGGKKHSFTKPTLVTAEASGQLTMLEFVFKKADNGGPLKLTLEKVPDVAAYTLNLSDDETSAFAQGLARGRAFSKSNPANERQGTHHLAFEPDTSAQGETGPQGMSFITVKVSMTGSLTWAGKLADGTAVTGGGAFCIPDSVVRGAIMPGFNMHNDLYKGGGSLHGALEANFFPGDHYVDFGGSASWNKAPLPERSSQRNYKDGFPVQEMMVTGCNYQIPAAGEIMLSIPKVENNAALAVYNQDRNNEGIWQAFTITDENKLVLPPLSPDTPLKTLEVNLAAGTYKGTIVLTNENPLNPALPWKRTATFEGVLLPGMQVAQGFCLVPELPDEPGETLANTPLRSCIVQFTKRWW